MTASSRIRSPPVPSSPITRRNAIAALKEHFLVVEGTCTHLGCLPKARFEPGATSPELGADWPGGFFCPCHGSNFDHGRSRVRRFAGIQNLRIPVYSYPNDNTLVIGVDAATTGAA